MTIRWYGLVAPEEAPTGDRRMFATQSLGFRDFPLPAAWQRVSGSGHANSVVVASWDSSYAGDGGVWGRGEFLDPVIVPEVVEAIYLLDKRLIGPSVDLDPDLSYDIVEHPSQPEQLAMKVTGATVHGLTFVMGPAFPQVHITVENDEEYTILASAGITHLTMEGESFAVNKSAWRSWPIAERETPFDFEDAISRIAQWSAGDAKKYAQAFLYQNKSLNPQNRESYRLPIADVHNGKLTLIPRGVMSAATILSGAHGGLDDVDQAERTAMQEVLTEIYDVLREQYGDPRFIAPWQRGGRDGATSSEAAPTEASMDAETFGIEDNGSEGESMSAASAPLAPPAAWFEDPKLPGLTKKVVTKEGWVYGHLASFKTCHLGVGNICTRAPKSVTGYKYFKQGSVNVDDGRTLEVGKLTIGAGHADPKYGVIPATEHYDNAATAIAVVNVGEDKFGIWFAGAVVPDANDVEVAQFRAAAVSGDWRRVGGNLELVAALAVNSPGFPIIEADSLTAAGVLVEDAVVAHEFDLSEVDHFLVIEDRRNRREEMAKIFGDGTSPEGCGCSV